MRAETTPAEFLEAELLMLPRRPGTARMSPVAPREGNYLPLLRSTSGESSAVRVIEGPARLAAGEGGTVVLQILSSHSIELSEGDEFTLVEHGVEVAIGRVLRFWRRR